MLGGESASLATRTSPLGRPAAAFGGAKHSSSARNTPPVEMTRVRVPLLSKTFTVLQVVGQTGLPMPGCMVGPSAAHNSFALEPGLRRVRTPLGPLQAFAIGHVGTLPAN